MKKQATIKGIKVTAKEWSGYGKKKIYFTIDKNTCGSAKANTIEWDVDKADFNYRCRQSFLSSPSVNNAEAEEWEREIKKAFNL
jgi:hypothetical protein